MWSGKGGMKGHIQLGSHIVLHSLYKFHFSCFVFSHFNHLLPASHSLLLHFNRDFHDYPTCSCFNLHKMSLRYQFAISSQAPIIWNDIPLTVRNSLTTTNFKKCRILIGLLLVYLSIVLSLLQDCMHVSLLNVRCVSCFSFRNLAYSLLFSVK